MFLANLFLTALIFGVSCQAAAGATAGESLSMSKNLRGARKDARSENVEVEHRGLLTIPTDAVRICIDFGNTTGTDLTWNVFHSECCLSNPLVGGNNDVAIPSDLQVLSTSGSEVCYKFDALVNQWYRFGIRDTSDSGTASATIINDGQTMLGPIPALSAVSEVDLYPWRVYNSAYDFDGKL